MLRLLADEHIRYAVIDGLKRRGIDVVVAQQIGLKATDDAKILAYAFGDGRVMYTCDSDYLALARAGVPHAGIFYHHQERYSIRESIRLVALACESYSLVQMRDRVEYL